MHVDFTGPMAGGRMYLIVIDAHSKWISQTMFSMFPIHVSWEPDQSYNVKNGCRCKLELVRANGVLLLQYSSNFPAVGCSQAELSYQ